MAYPGTDNQEKGRNQFWRKEQVGCSGEMLEEVRKEGVQMRHPLGSVGEVGEFSSVRAGERGRLRDSRQSPI